MVSMRWRRSNANTLLDVIITDGNSISGHNYLYTSIIDTVHIEREF